MAFSFEERPSSRQKTSNPPSLVMEYVADGEADQATVTAFAHAAVPSVQAVIEGTLYRQDLKVAPQGHKLFYITVPYGPRKYETGSYRFTFDTTGGTIHIASSKQSIAVAAGKGLHAADIVAREFSDHGWDNPRIMVIPNDRELREVASFLPLLISMADPDERQATFYAHTKGNSTAGSVEGSVYWRNAMYHHLLDRVGDCMEELETHACVGTHKMIWPPDHEPPYPTRLRHGHWMLAGTFFWFRNDRVFSHPRWRHVPADRYGAEAWLSGMFPPQDAASVFQLWDEWTYPTPNPYDPALYPDPIADE